MILEIYRDRLKQGSEDTFRAVEEDAARICADLQFPHAHLAIEALTGPREVWWLNAFESDAEIQQVARDFAQNPALVAALGLISKRREGLTETPIDTFASYRADLSRGAHWKLVGARFFAVTVTKGEPQAEGSVFEAPDGTRFILLPVRTRRQADAAATAAGGEGETTVFAVRPYWECPRRSGSLPTRSSGNRTRCRRQGSTDAHRGR